MKLKILPPHLRNKKRYLTFEVISQTPLNRDEVISILWGALGEMYGACGAGRLDLWVIKVWNVHHHGKNGIPGENAMKGIVRCNREEVRLVRSIIPSITHFKGNRVVFHTLGISGTINSAMKKFIKVKEAHK